MSSSWWDFDSEVGIGSHASDNDSDRAAPVGEESAGVRLLSSPHRPAYSLPPRGK